MAKYEVVEDEETKDDSGKQPQLDVEEETKESKPLSAKKKAHYEPACRHGS